jgi:hypothetical protein
VLRGSTRQFPVVRSVVLGRVGLDRRGDWIVVVDFGVGN